MALEKGYRDYVQTDDLTSYRSFWQPSFLDWPYISPEPRGKDHFADWIIAYKKNGETLGRHSPIHKGH